MSSKCALILAAGEGTRMKTSKPKVLVEVLFKPMIDWVIDAAVNGGVDDICVVTGYRHEMLEEHLGEKYKTVVQEERLGTGHAVMQAKDFIKQHIHDNILILNGDNPLVSAETIKSAYEYHAASKNAVTVISAKLDNPFGYGRIVRNKDKCLKKIVEECDTTPAEKIITEVNTGAYWFNCSVLLDTLDGIAEMYKKNGRKEYFLTDAVEVILEKKLNAVAFEADSDAARGAKNRVQLQELSEIARHNIMRKHMLNGVSIPCPDGVIISPEAEIGAETEILPGTAIKGNSVIGSGCVIGPNTYIEDSIIGDGVTMFTTYCYSSEVKSNTSVGPFVRIRPGSVIGEDVKVGNFVELKNATVGDKTSIAHLTYIGDADVGSNVNFGCGCATANFTGKEKFRTSVGDNAFIGCDTCLVAPVQVGKNAYTAAGSVITEDVPDDALAIARSKQSVKKDWVTKKKPFRWQK